MTDGTDDSRTLPDSGGPAPREGTIAIDDATAVSGVYAMGAVIGRGGMGEVVAAHDRRIGRDVALKRMRARRAERDDVARFVREAQIQARLEHPGDRAGLRARPRSRRACRTSR